MTGLLSDALRNAANVAWIDCTALGLTRTDRSASRKADKDAGATVEAASVKVKRLAGVEELPKAIMAFQKEAQDNLKAHSTAWGDRRLLPNINFNDWIGKHGQIEDNFNTANKEFIDRADEIVAQARTNIGTYDIALPTRAEIERAYSLSYKIEPIPDGNHFKGSAEVERLLKERFEENVKAAHVAAQQDALKRLANPLSKLAERMEAYDRRVKEINNGGEQKEGIFRDSIIENVQAIAGVFASFNVLGDPQMDDIAAKIKAFTQIDGDMLRKRSDIRAAASMRAKEVLAQLDDLLIK